MKKDELERVAELSAYIDNETRRIKRVYANFRRRFPEGVPVMDEDFYNTFLEELTDSTRDLKKKQGELDRLRDVIRGELPGIENDLTRRIIKLRYVHGCTWSEIGAACCYDPAYMMEIKRNYFKSLNV